VKGTPDLPRRSKAGVRLAFLLAARNLRRSTGRSALIASLVALPVIGMAGAATVGLSTIGSPAQTTQARLGHMAAVVDLTGYAVSQSPSSDSWEGRKLKPGVSTDPREFVPHRWRVVPLQPAQLYLTTASGVANFQGWAGRSWDPAFAGRYELLAGRAPGGSDEILVSPAALARLGARVGDTVTSGDGSTSFRVVGTMRDLTLSASSEQVFGGASAFPLTSDDPQVSVWYLAGPPVDLPTMHDFNKHGAVVQSRALTERLTSADYGGASSSSGWAVVALVGIAGAFVLFEIALLSGAAFLVIARQQQRALAVLASVGADRQLLARSVAVGGILLGLVGSLAGVLIGIGAAALVMRLVGDGSDTQFFGFVVDGRVLAVIVVVAVLTSWIAAAAPSRSATRFDVVAALRGARRPARPSRLAPAIGAVVMIVGATVAILGGILTVIVNTRNPPPPGVIWIGPTLIVIGSIVLQLGAVLGVPLLLRLLSRATSRGSASVRMATRDLARNSARSVPAIAAVMSTVFVAAFLMSVLSNGEQSNALTYQYRGPLGSTTIQFTPADPSVPTPDADGYVTAADRVLGVSNARLIYGAPDPRLSNAVTKRPTAGRAIPAPRLNTAARCVYVQDGNNGCTAPVYLASLGVGVHLVVGDADDLAAILGRAPSRAALAALDDGRAVAMYPQYVENHRVTLEWWTPAQIFDGKNYQADGVPTRSDTLSAVVDSPTPLDGFGVMISPATADRLGIPVVPQVVLATDVSATTSQQDALNAYLQSHGTASAPAGFVVAETGPTQYAGVFAWLVLAVAGLITLGASVIALGLARIDGRRDEFIIGAVGAPPSTMRGIVFWQSLVLAGLGSLIGTAVALVPAYALSLSLPTPAFAPPWVPLAATAIGVPLLIAVMTAITRRTRRPLLLGRNAID